MATRKNEAKWIEARQRWQINVQDDGERKTFASAVVGPKGKIEAEKRADKWLERKHGKDIRLEVLWADFLANEKIVNGSANYIKHESIGRNWLLSPLGHKRISSITVGDWQDCINAAFTAGRTKKTCQNIRASITALYSFAHKKRVPMERPDDITIPKGAKSKERNIMQPDGLKILFAHDTITHYGRPKPCWYIHAWRFYVVTGLRRGELAGLQKSDYQDGMLMIRRSINSLNEVTGGKNENAKRYILLWERAQAILDDQANMLKRAGIISKWLFPGEDGLKSDPNHIYGRWHTYRKQHGLINNINEMRHTMVSVSRADVPDQLLKRVVGHSKSMDTFGIYGHDVDGELQRSAALIDSAFDRLLK